MSDNDNDSINKWRARREQDEKNRVAEEARQRQVAEGGEDFRTGTTDSQDSEEGEYFVYDGRTYNNTSWAYRFPADQEEVIRLDRQHYILSAILPGLYRGPVEEVLANDPTKNRRLLDIGCGTGIWLAEMAERFPHVDCVGIDIMNIQHDHHLENCTYMNVEAPRRLHMFPDRSFDVIQVRQMLSSIYHYPELLKECYRLLRPGGLMLVHEPAGQYYSAWEGYEVSDLAPALHSWIEIFRNSFEYRGIRLDQFNHITDFLMGAGFDRTRINVDVQHRAVCQEDQSTVLAQNEIAHALSFVHASRLMILESGQLTTSQFDQLREDAYNELHLQGRGPAGPLGASGIVSPWCYWWVRKV
ncbi:S-adenosyl-L-methionine-dependent methyltransferase [Naematelia encephala]|uniref:S-adenosyl-L-methionine-dependent methyltransferase n=1 Tax=Naematelia encephala TaxID=71784 RepID=A0A1Y2BDG2_9TREE|nr:S-adenosyl-L-methionine-dependent methyltransferase [Naematelia encephala]